jgi:hypothetical protein
MCPEGSKSSDTGLLSVAAVAPDDGSFFQIAKLDIASRDEHPDLTAGDEKVDDSPEQTTNADTQSLQLSGSDENGNDDGDNDIWIAPKPKVIKSPTHKIWDRFSNGIAASPQATLLTEAGPDAYDALLSWAEDRLNLNEKDACVVESKAFASSLLALALGRESWLFTKIKPSHSFQATLSRIRTPGYSSRVLGGLIKQCMQCGTITLKLRSFVHQAYASNSTQCSVALASALEEILLAVQHNLVLKNDQPRSLLQLQSTVEELSSILNPFHELASSIADGHRDEDIMKLVYDHAYKAEISEDWLREIMQETLRRISAPWIKFLEEWIGTRREEGMPFTKSNVGEVRGFVKVESEIYTDDFGEEVEDVDFRLDWSKIPPFMPEDIIKKAFEAGRNLRFLRSSHPTHPMAKSNFTSLHPPPETKWLFSWEDILGMESAYLLSRRQTACSLWMWMELRSKS